MTELSLNNAGKKIWREEETFCLLRKIRQHPCLWNPKHMRGNTAESVQALAHVIAAHYGTTVRTIRLHMYCLFEMFEKHLFLERLHGKGKFKSSWPFFEAMRYFELKRFFSVTIRDKIKWYVMQMDDDEWIRNYNIKNSSGGHYWRCLCNQDIRDLIRINVPNAHEPMAVRAIYELNPTSYGNEGIDTPSVTIHVGVNAESYPDKHALKRRIKIFVSTASPKDDVAFWENGQENNENKQLYHDHQLADTSDIELVEPPSKTEVEEELVKFNAECKAFYTRYTDKDFEYYSSGDDTEDSESQSEIEIETKSESADEESENYEDMFGKHARSKKMKIDVAIIDLTADRIRNSVRNKETVLFDDANLLGRSILYKTFNEDDSKNNTEDGSPKHMTTPWRRPSRL